MKNLAAAFRPNRVVSAQSMRLITLGWAVIFLGWWQLFSERPIPTPAKILAAYVSIWNGSSIAPHVLSSLVLNIEATLLSTLISCTLAYGAVLAGLRPVAKFVSLLRYLGLTGLTFVVGMYFSGHGYKLVLVTFGMTVFLHTSMLGIMAAIPPQRFHYARTLRMGEWRAVYEVAVKGTLDQVIDAVRQNAAVGWMMLTGIEGLVRNEGGIGTLLLNQNKQFNMATVFALQFLLFAIALIQDYGFGVFRNIMCPWSVLAKKNRGNK